MSANARPAGFEISGRHVLYAFLAFFGLIFAVNGVFLYAAVGSFPGEETKKSYLQGLRYNDVLAERAADRALGWSATAGIARAGADARVAMDFAGADGRPLTGLTVKGVLKRPVEDGHDVALAFEPAGEGAYRAHVSAPAAGVWDLAVTAADADGNAFEVRKRLWLR